jgi:uncharacterized RDD family membrane protein YckC
MTSLPAPAPEMTVGRQGDYAGAISRLAAFAADVGASWGLYTAGAALLTLASQVFTAKTVAITHHQIPALIALVVWEFLYFSYTWTVSGKTIGMAVLGLQVVTAAGSPISRRQAVLRTVALPLSIALFPIALPGVLFQRERRTLHDFIAGTAVVYAWDARAARLRWMSRTTFADTQVPT